MTPNEKNKKSNEELQQKEKLHDDKVEGYLNTFIVHGLSAMFNKSDKDQKG